MHSCMGYNYKHSTTTTHYEEYQSILESTRETLFYFHCNMFVGKMVIWENVWSNLSLNWKLLFIVAICR